MNWSMWSRWCTAFYGVLSSETQKTLCYCWKNDARNWPFWTMPQCAANSVAPAPGRSALGPQIHKFSGLFSALFTEDMAPWICLGPSAPECAECNAFCDTFSAHGFVMFLSWLNMLRAALFVMVCSKHGMVPWPFCLEVSRATFRCAAGSFRGFNSQGCFSFIGLRKPRQMLPNFLIIYYYIYILYISRPDKLPPRAAPPLDPGCGAHPLRDAALLWPKFMAKTLQASWLSALRAPLARCFGKNSSLPRPWRAFFGQSFILAALFWPKFFKIHGFGRFARPWRAVSPFWNPLPAKCGSHPAGAIYLTTI